MVLCAEMRVSAWVILTAEELGCERSSLMKSWLCKAKAASVPGLKRQSADFSLKGKSGAKLMPLFLCLWRVMAVGYRMHLQLIWVCLPRWVSRRAFQSLYGPTPAVSVTLGQKPLYENLTKQSPNLCWDLTRWSRGALLDFTHGGSYKSFPPPLPPLIHFQA